jgi:hypothetical protein
LAKSWLKKEPVNWKSVGAAALGGAATGALATATFGTGLLAGSAATQVTGLAVAGATGGAVETATDNVLHDREWHEDVGKNAAIGGALGAVAGVGRVALPHLARAAGQLAPVRAAGRHIQSVYRPVASTVSRAAAPVIRGTKTAWGHYLNAMKRWPMRTKIATSGGLTAFADVLSQYFEGKKSWDWKRTAFRTGWGMAISAPVGHYWMVGLDKMIKGTGVMSTIAKVAIDQFGFYPIFSSLFFGSYAMVHDGATPKEAWERIKSDVPKAAAASVSVWPAVNFVKFKYIPLDMRIPFSKAFGTVYNVFFGMFFLAEKEEGAEGEEGEASQQLNHPLDCPMPASKQTIATYANAWGQIAKHYDNLTGGSDEPETADASSGLQDMGKRYLEAYDLVEEAEADHSLVESLELIGVGQ